jgi:hypothetical protein
MSNVADHERIREIMRRLDEIQRESELLRARIAAMRGRAVEFPERPPGSRSFDDIRRVDDQRSSGSDERAD